MRLFFVLSILCLFSCTQKSMVSQIKITKEAPAYFVVLYQQDSFLVSLKKEYDFAIITNINRPADYGGVEYQALCLKGKQWYHIDYKRRHFTSAGELPYDLKRNVIKSKKADSTIKIFIDNRFLDIPDKDLGCRPEEYGVDPKDRNPKKNCNPSSHASTDVIILFTKNNYSFKEYLDVEKMNACCPGNKDREFFIKCWNAVKSLE